jgi:Ca-activated chloride channel family protein
MKEQFDRYQDSMTASERAEVWQRLQGAFGARGAAGEADSRRAREAREARGARARQDGARRAMLWPAYRLAGSLAVGVVAVGVAVAVYEGGRGDRLARKNAGELASMTDAADGVDALPSMPPGSHSIQIHLGGDSTSARDRDAAANSFDESERLQTAADSRPAPYPDPTINLRPRETVAKGESDASHDGENAWGSVKGLHRGDEGETSALAKAPSALGDATDGSMLMTGSAPPAAPEGESVAAARATTESAPPIAARSREALIAASTGPSARATADDSLTITGVITDAKTGDPIAYAAVVVEGMSKGTTTKTDGSFTIRGMAPGSYTLFVSVHGYELQTATVAVSAPTVELVRIALDEAEVPTLASQADYGSTIDVESSASEAKIDTKQQFKHRAVNNVQDALKKPKPKETKGWGEIKGLYDGGSEKRAVGIEGLSGGAGQGWGGTSSLLPQTMQAPADAHQPVYGGTTLPNDEVYDSMFFEHYGVNPFIPTDEDSLSTFAVDVDAASYTVARRYIDGGNLPPKEAARVEEFVNFFRQDYPRFDDVDFRIFVEGAPSPFANGYQLVRVGIKGREVAAANRKPANLTFVIDTSGSMQREDRLELVKRALHVLLDELRPDDRVAIVEYGNEARVVLEPTSLGSDVEPIAHEERGLGDWDEGEGRSWPAGRAEIERAIDGLYPGGGTNAEAGLAIGYDVASRSYERGAINRIILCSDGVANIGRTGGESILESVRREADRGIHLSAIGFGMGNYNDVLLEELANKGDGNYYYVDDLDEAKRVFVENLTGTLQTIAKDAKVQVEFDPQRVLRYRLLGFENRDVADKDFRNDAIDAGEIGAGHTVTALYEVKVAPGVSRGTLATVRLRYARPEHEVEGDPRMGTRGTRSEEPDRRSDGGDGGDRGAPPRAGASGDGGSSMQLAAREISEQFDARDLARRFEDASPRFRLDAVVAELAEILRHSYWAKESTIAALVPMARDLARERSLQNDAEVAEFAGLVERAANLDSKLSPDERRALQPPPLPPGMRDGVSMR